MTGFRRSVGGWVVRNVVKSLGRRGLYLLPLPLVGSFVRRYVRVCLGGQMGVDDSGSLGEYFDALSVIEVAETEPS